jgi:hypothetical protein
VVVLGDAVVVYLVVDVERVVVDARNGPRNWLVSYVSTVRWFVTCWWETADDADLDVLGVRWELEFQLSGNQAIEGGVEFC